LGLQNLLAIVFLSEKDNITPLKRTFRHSIECFSELFFGIRLHMNAAGFAIGTAISWTVLCLWLYMSWARRHQIRTWGIVKGSVEEHSCSSTNASSHFGVEAVFAL